MGKEGLTAQDRDTRTDTDVIIAKDILGSVKKDAFFFMRKLFADTDPFHCSTSAGRF
jgi:hypothetical protein